MRVSYEADRLRRGPQAIEGGAFRDAACLVALRADEALVLARVDANVPLASLSSGGARQIGAACGCGVHDDPPGVAWQHARRSMSGPLFSLQVSLTTVKWRAPTPWQPMV